MSPPQGPQRPEFDSDDSESHAKKPIRTSPPGRGTAACPNCGNNSYSWGIVRGHYDMKYIGDDAGFWSKSTVFGGQPVRARKCNSCGNIQLFAGA